MLWIERKWIDLVSPQLERFKWKTDSTANFRCPVCGDSEKDQRKARAYLIVHKGQYFMKCHNCGVSMSFNRFLKSEFPETYSQYQMDLLKEKSSTKKSSKQEIKKTGIEEKFSASDDESSFDEGWVYIEDLPDDHIAKRYIHTRNVPRSAYDHIVYTDNFCQWVMDNSGLSKYKNRLPKDKRILFPIVDERKRLLGVQGRVIGDVRSNTLRYITIKFKDTYSKLYGLDRVDFNKPIVVVEGPMDSLFLPNSIALCGGDVSMSLSKYSKDNFIIALDNEPRNKDTIERMKDAIDQGYNIVVWNNISSKYKDINDMIINGGMSPDDIMIHINNNTTKGMAARLMLSSWKKV